MRTVLLMLVMSVAISAQSPFYTATTIMPDGVRQPAPLAPGMLVSVYGDHLGPTTPCNAAPDPLLRETANPRRPNQTGIETQVFPKRLCDVEVTVGGIPAGLLHVKASQINFKVPQEVAVQGTTVVQVTYQEHSGPPITVALSNMPHTESAAQLTDRIWTALSTVPWQAPYANGCSAVEPMIGSSGLYGHAYFCAQRINDVVAETFYYPAAGNPPTLRLRRADFHLAIEYPVMGREVEQLLTQRLTQAYGPGTVPVGIYELGASKPNPGLSWIAGDVTIFLHRNQNFAPGPGVRTGVLLASRPPGSAE